MEVWKPSSGGREYDLYMWKPHGLKSLILNRQLYNYNIILYAFNQVLL